MLLSFSKRMWTEKQTSSHSQYQIQIQSKTSGNTSKNIIVLRILQLILWYFGFTLFLLRLRQTWIFSRIISFNEINWGWKFGLTPLRVSEQRLIKWFRRSCPEFDVTESCWDYRIMALARWQVDLCLWQYAE